MIVEGRERLTLFHDFANASKPLQQSNERLAHLKNDVCACVGYQLCITAKLNCVPQSLLAVQQNGLIQKGFPAKPEGLNEVALVLSRIFCFPSPFIKLKTLLNVSIEKERQGLIPIGFGIIR